MQPWAQDNYIHCTNSPTMTGTAQMPNKIILATYYESSYMKQQQNECNLHTLAILPQHKKQFTGSRHVFMTTNQR